MPDLDYATLDSWSDAEISQFKEEALTTDLANNLGIVVVEGDSWTDYGAGTDIVDWLRKGHNYKILNFGKGGDTLENMIYGTDITKKFKRRTPTIKKVLRKVEELRPKVFIFSGGGNDIAGDEFESFLNHKSSGLPSFRHEYGDYMVNIVFKKYYEDLIEMINQKSPQTRIFTHGYGHTIPTGEAVEFLWINFAGPWILPALTKKGITNPGEQKNIVFDWIDKFNEMLQSLDEEHERFHFVDLRPIIDAENDWSNELHLKNSGYAKVADLFNTKIQEIVNE